ncbi:MAG: hypothetical protein JRF59_06825 [Deltaproteobacteria bacterium]|nr:hypothetical protein [Deltaproteobacteria bacterium]
MKNRNCAVPMIVLAAGLPPLLLLYFIWRQAVNLPYMDQWDGFFLQILLPLREGCLNLGSLWRQHNEHRLFFPRLIMLALALPSRWNVVWEQYASVCLQGITFVFVAATAGRTFTPGRRRPLQLFIVLASILLFSMVQHENWAWGWQLQVYLNLLAAAMAFWASAGGPQRLRRLLLAASACLLGTFSFANGLILWWVLFPWILRGPKGPARTARAIFWLILSLGSAGAYFSGYRHPVHHPNLTLFLEDPASFCMFFLAYLGAPLGKPLGTGAAALLGLLGLLASFAALFRVLREGHRIPDPARPWFASIAFVVLSALATALGRMGFGPSHALASRYTAFSTFFWVGLAAVLFLNDHPYGVFTGQAGPLRKWVISLLFTGLIVLHALAYAQGLSAFTAHNANLRDTLDLLRYDRVYGGGDRFGRIYPDLKILGRAILRLRQQGLGPFHKDIKKPRGLYAQWPPRLVKEGLFRPSRESLVPKEPPFDLILEQDGGYEVFLDVGTCTCPAIIRLLMDGELLGTGRCTGRRRAGSPRSSLLPIGRLTVARGRHRFEVMKNDPSCRVRGLVLIPARAGGLKE